MGELRGQPVLECRGLQVHAGPRLVLRDIDLSIGECEVFGIVGPSGVGKSTLLRGLNRLIDLSPALRTEGEVRWRDRSIRAPDVDVDALRARLGMIFQQPVIFPTTIHGNVLFGRRHLQRLSRAEGSVWVERALREAALWDEVKDRLHESALRLSVGQQQRLCLARTLAVEPEVLLLDEPTSALDGKSTEAIEDLIVRLKATRTLVLVTHNMRQAQRLTDRLAVLSLRDGAGEVTAVGPPDDLLSSAPPAGQSVDGRRPPQGDGLKSL